MLSKDKPKIICVNIFFSTLAYVIWFGSFPMILIGIGATYVELQTVTLELFPSTNYYSEFCYNSAFQHKKVCSWDEEHLLTQSSNPDWKRNPIQNRNTSLWALLIIDFIVLSIWLYRKQQKFKLSWCDS